MKIGNLLSLLLFALISVSCKTDKVVIALPSGAPSAVVSAAEDLRKGLAKVFPGDRFTVQEGFVASGSSRCISIVIEDGDAPEAFRIRKTETGALRIAGSDALGCAYGVYALLEYYGCGFYMTYDAYPKPEKGKWRLPEQELSDRPLCRERYSFNWHNFISGCSGWNLEDWKSWIDQNRKMRYNVVMVHAYGNNPMFTFEFNGIRKPVGWLASTEKGRDWGTPHVNDVRRMVCGKLFDGPVFGAAPALLPDTQQAEAVRAMMQEVFRYAHAQGMKIAFQLDIDTDPAISVKTVASLPETAKIKVGDTVRPNPDTPEGRAYYKAVFDALFGLYPEIDNFVICTRADPVPSGKWDAATFPDEWKKEYDELLKGDFLTPPDKQKLAAYFWVGKVIGTFEAIARESAHKGISFSQGSWNFARWIEYADACSPKDVLLLPLDYDIINSRPEFASPKGVELMKKLTSSGRRLAPIIWSHHDDAHYLGRTYTPYDKFATRLEEVGCDSYGIIHWLLRPHGLFFKSHSVQTWEATKDQPLEETCRTMGRTLFGAENEAAGGAYLLDWVTTAPIYGQETGNVLFGWVGARFYNDSLLNTIREGTERRKALLAGVKPVAGMPEAPKHLAYWQGLEDFNLSILTDETTLRNSLRALANGDAAKSRDYISKTNPAASIEAYERYASKLGLLRGDLGVITQMNLRWLPTFVGQKQLLGLDDYRINFAPTVHEPLAQGAGLRSWFIDVTGKLWLVQGNAELSGEEWTADGKMKTSGLSAAEKEIAQNGLAWQKDTVKISIVPATQSSFANTKAFAQLPVKGKLRLIVADPSIKTDGESEFAVLLCSGDKQSVLGTVQPRPDLAEAFEFDVNAPQQVVIALVPTKGQRISVCGATLKNE